MRQEEETEDRERAAVGRRGLRSSLRANAERYGLLLAWIAEFVLFALWAPQTFPTWSNFRTVFSSQTVLLILTLALVLGLSAGEFDLSVASLAGLVSTLTAYLTLHGWPIVLAILLMLAFGLLVGAMHAWFIVRVGVPSLVVTLATGTLFVGLSIGITGPQPTYLQAPGFTDLVNTSLGGLNLAWYFALFLTVALFYLLELTPLGRYIRFVGASPEVSRLVGIPVKGVRLLTLVGSSLLAVVAGLILVGLQGSGDISVSSSLLLPAFAGAFLGATAITPGRFNAWGSFAAIYFLVTGITGLQLVGFSGWVDQVFYGASLIIAATVAQVLARAARRTVIEEESPIAETRV